jgi:hypothetical protein
LVDSGGGASRKGLGDVGVAQGLGVDNLLGGLLVDNDLLGDNLRLGLDLLLGGFGDPGDGLNEGGQDGEGGDGQEESGDDEDGAPGLVDVLVLDLEGLDVSEGDLVVGVVEVGVDVLQEGGSENPVGGLSLGHGGGLSEQEDASAIVLFNEEVSGLDGELVVLGVRVAFEDEDEGVVVGLQVAGAVGGDGVTIEGDAQTSEGFSVGLRVHSDGGGGGVEYSGVSTWGTLIQWQVLLGQVNLRNLQGPSVGSHSTSLSVVQGEREQLFGQIALGLSEEDLVHLLVEQEGEGLGLQPELGADSAAQVR